jgi:RNA polymerase sigma-70 factor (ECF subfamily)
VDLNNSDISISGGKPGFREFIEPQLPVLLRVARGITGSKADADDLVQETVLRAFKAHPRAWLLTIMRNTHVNMHRRKRPALVDDWKFLEPYPLAFSKEENLSAEDIFIKNNLSAELIKGLNSLDLRFREVLYLIDIEGLNYSECSSLLGQPVGTVTSRLSRARNKLRTYLIQNQAFEGQYS